MKYNKSLDHALMATYFARKAVKAKSAKLKASFRNKALKSILAAGSQRDAEQGMRVLEASLRLAAANEGLVDEELPEVDMEVEAGEAFDDLDVDVEADADEDIELDEDIDVEADAYADEEDDDVEVDVELDDEDDEDDEAEEVSASVKRIMARATARKRLAARAMARKRLAARARIRR